MTPAGWPSLLGEITAHLRPAPTADQVRGLESLPARSAEESTIPESMDPRLRRALSSLGIASLYRHQAEAYAAVGEGRDVIVTTSTASGKTLCFNLPILDAILREPATRALYLYPTKALGNDQRAALARLITGTGQRVSVAVFTGDTEQDERDRIRSSPPHILIGNPDIIHFQQLPYHDTWERWWTNLSFIVVDEAHVYRGVFGSHVAHVLRRALRIALHYGASPQVIAASATIGNPEELLEELTGRPPRLISRDGSPRSRRDVVIWHPAVRQWTPLGPIYESVEDTTAHVVTAAMLSGRTAIAFARSRPLVERIRRLVDRELQERGHAHLRERVASYRAGYDVDRRREIEGALRSGSLQAVISTVALELGIDIGSLDVAVLSSYPGSRMSFWQQSGRAGRRDRDALVMLVPSQNPLDQYFCAHPNRLVDAHAEDAALDASNPEVAVGQLACAARELRLTETRDGDLYGASILRNIPVAEGRGVLVVQRRGWVAAPGRGRPDEVSIRSIDDDRYALLVGRDNIGEIGNRYIPREAHPGAIYLHDGDPYRVLAVDRVSRVVRLKPSEEGLLTNPIGHRDVLVTHEVSRRGVRGLLLEARFVRVKAVDEIVAYLQIDERTRRPRGGPIELDTPMGLTLDTEAVQLLGDTHLLASALHGVEHMLRALGSLVVLCDATDLEGHTEMEGQPVAFVFDRNPGGTGLAGRLYDRLEEVADAARDRIAGCPCEEGCPACIQSGTCLRRNDGLDKRATRNLLRASD
jgi:DEAD/DEAH box helicase domain-containing protein